MCKDGDPLAYAGKPALSRTATEAALLVAESKPALPDKLTLVYRGEEPPKGAQSGRGPEDVRKAGGFKSWKFTNKVITTIDDARKALRNLAENGELQKEAQAWCEKKNQENGWFFSTATMKEAAYDTYEHFYLLDLRKNPESDPNKNPDREFGEDEEGLVRRTWESVGLETAKNVEKMHLYTDAEQLDNSRLVAVIWDFWTRRKELLFMSPVPSDRIWVWKKAEGEEPGEWQHLPVWTAGSGS